MTQAIYINDLLDQGYENAEEIYRPILAQKEAELVEKDHVIVANKVELAEKDKTIAERDNTIAEKENAISEKDKEIAFLKSELEKRIREQLLHKN